MSTSDQQGDRPLTRKQLREIRLTGATPVIGEEEAAAAAASARPAVPLPRAAEPVEVAPRPVDDVDAESGAAPLTRRQARAQERVRTASVPIVEPGTHEPAEDAAAEDAADDEEMVSGVPRFAPVSAQARDERPVFEAPGVEPAPTASEDDVDAEADDVATAFDESAEQAQQEDAEQETAGDEDERPVVSPAFGRQVLGEPAEVPAFSPSFDELITSDSTGSHRTPNTLIFTHPGEASLSGPVASTGEVLITGSYELPQGIGSQGHAEGTADGKDIDAVLIDGELPPASSPTPIAASSAVSTIKPAGEVIRPPAPEKGNKLMLILAITAGGLALLVAAALVAAFTMNVFG